MDFLKKINLSTPIFFSQSRTQLQGTYPMIEQEKEPKGK